MRTHKKHGILLAGVNGFKIYCKDNAFVIVGRYTSKVVAPEHEQTVRNYVNLKYLPISEQDAAKVAFLTLTEGVR